MSQLRLEDLKWEGTSYRTFSIPRNIPRTVMKFMEPVIDSEEFQFSLKIHSIQGGMGMRGNLLVGVCDKNHPKRVRNKNCFFGQHGGIGWGWNTGGPVYGPKGFKKDLKETFGSNDLLTVSVNRGGKWIEFLKNKKSVGKIENLENIPKELVIAVAIFHKTNFELIEFSCKPKGPLMPTKEEILTKELEKLKEEMKLLKITCDSQERKIEENRKFLEIVRVKLEL